MPCSENALYFLGQYFVSMTSLYSYASNKIASSCVKKFFPFYNMSNLNVTLMNANYVFCQQLVFHGEKTNGMLVLKKKGATLSITCASIL